MKKDKKDPQVSALDELLGPSEDESEEEESPVDEVEEKKSKGDPQALLDSIQAEVSELRELLSNMG